MKRLYKVDLEMTFYAYAESEHEAEWLAADALRDNTPDAHASEVCLGDSIDPDWNEECLVYQAEKGDISLGSVWPKDER